LTFFAGGPIYFLAAKKISLQNSLYFLKKPHYDSSNKLMFLPARTEMAHNAIIRGVLVSCLLQARTRAAAQGAATKGHC
jgi:hypothetical protein